MTINIWKKQHLDLVKELPTEVLSAIETLDENYGTERTAEDLGGYVAVVDKSGIKELKQKQLKGIIPEYIDEIEIVNNKLLLKKVINNVNQNKSSKLKPKLDEMNVVNKEIDRLSSKKNSSIELFEDGILTKNELSQRIKKLNEEIDTLKFRLDELKQDVMLADGEPVPFELVSQVMNKFGEIFKESSTRQQRKQLLNLLVSKITIDKSRNIDSIELQINEDVITYLMK